jgi:hypothetical protein
MNRKEADLFLTLARLIEAHFRGLRRTVRKNLSRLTCAFLRLALSVRFGYGGLHLTSVARVLPEGVQFKSSYKWLSRFLKCPYFDPSSLAEYMLALLLGQKPPPWVILLVDQTSVDGVQVVSAAIPLEGRAVPVAGVDFEYPWKTLPPPSQNTLERYLLTWLGEAAPRGYASGPDTTSVLQAEAAANLAGIFSRNVAVHQQMTLIDARDATFLFPKFYDLNSTTSLFKVLPLLSHDPADKRSALMRFLLTLPHVDLRDPDQRDAAKSSLDSLVAR